MGVRTSTLRRRAVSVPGLFLAALALLVLLPVWLPLAIVFDLARLRPRLPLSRLLLFGLCWSWLESAGVVVAGGLWLIGQARNRRAHDRLQRWWVANLMRALRATTGIRIEAADVTAFSPGPAIALIRHASLADSLVSAWVITNVADMQVRFVLKRELLADPCLDIVGHRLPNHFLDREATDSAVELEALSAMAAGMTADEVAVIFPEGTRASPKKRQRQLDRLAERDPARAVRLRPLVNLIPPRPAGAAALLAGAPHADVVIGWHVGFDGLDTFGGILRHLAHPPPPVRFAAKRIPRADVPDGMAFVDWLDTVWLTMDADVNALNGLTPPGAAR